MILIRSLQWIFKGVSHSRLTSIAHILAIILFDILRVRRNIILKNLDLVFGTQLTRTEKIKMGRKSVESFVLTALEFVMFSKLWPQVRFEALGSEHMEAAVAQKRGVYVAGVHQGNWEYMCAFGATHYGKATMALKPVGTPSIQAWVRATRESFGVREVPRRASKPAWQILVEGMKRRELVAHVTDQRRTKGISVNLFGHPTLTNASLFRLWKTHPAPIIPFTNRRLKGLAFEIKMWPEFEVATDPSWSEEEFLRVNCQRLNELVERMILVAPEQYFWMHNRWKKVRE